ncbi:MAG: hypothetical protein KDK64_02455 [Chlamydiia bacterium]|nr:hypothetical protein [Chlamydiia bacterium]
MKKALLVLAALTTPLLAQDSLPPPDLSTPPLEIPDAPFRERTEKQETSQSKKAAVAIIGTIAAITIGLLVSGSDTGKHIKPREFRDDSST